jgi:hypothetical protein
MRLDHGIHIGDPVRDVHGVLTGAFQLVGRGLDNGMSVPGRAGP